MYKPTLVSRSPPLVLTMAPTRVTAFGWNDTVRPFLHSALPC